jgi:hypothetical protein
MFGVGYAYFAGNLSKHLHHRRHPSDSGPNHLCCRDSSATFSFQPPDLARLSGDVCCRIGLLLGI